MPLLAFMLFLVDNDGHDHYYNTPEILCRHITIATARMKIIWSLRGWRDCLISFCFLREHGTLLRASSTVINVSLPSFTNSYVLLQLICIFSFISRIEYMLVLYSILCRIEYSHKVYTHGPLVDLVTEFRHICSKYSSTPSNLLYMQSRHARTFLGPV
jgi:hypothetical protein